MFEIMKSAFIFTLAFPRIANAQFSNWVSGQINTSICIWNQPRAAIVRSKIYIDGGSAWWTAGLDNGQMGDLANQGNYQGIILSYDLNRPFNSTTNITGILLDGSMSKARGGTGNSNGASPNYYDGALLANDAEFFLYGGAVFQNNELYDPPPEDEVLEYQAYAYGPDKPLWKPGFNDRRLPSGVTRYIAYGGAASAPSENKAWYFSGLTAPGRGPMFSDTSNASTTASIPSDTLITLDMADQLGEKWTNVTLPDTIKGRANPEVVWVPVGKQGILVVLGGVLYPEWTTPKHTSQNETASKAQSPTFMSTIDVFDIANNRWYKQPTNGGPGMTTRGCAVVAPAADRSSFNIYYYGGFDGMDPTNEFYDNVWVLSLPSFTWTLINKGTARHARAGHQCFLPYPDQMMVVGGYTSLAGTELTCLENGPIVMFNITSGEWMDSYDPAHYGAYGVPKEVQATIGGSAAGHATATAPSPSGWATPGLGDVFATKYDVGKIKAYWPYTNDGSTTNKTASPGEPTPSVAPKARGVPSWVAPVLGVVMGLVFLTGGILIFCIARRRRADRRRSFSTSSHEAMSERLFYWAKSHYPQQKPAPTVTSSAQSDVERSETRTWSPADEVPAVAQEACHEMDDTQITEIGGTHYTEMDDTSSPVELYGTGLTTAEAMRKVAGFTPLITSFKSYGSLRSSESQGQGTGSIGEVTPSTPIHRSLMARQMSTISSVSFDSGGGSGSGTNAHSPNSIVSPIGPVTTPAGDEENTVAAGSPLRNVISGKDFRHDGGKA